jgi:4'-phosphopantetheinyl transferase EntD
VIEQLVPEPVVVVEAFRDVPGEQPYPGEEAYIEGAVESRRREFITARRCARQALTLLGHAPALIARSRRGEPHWPDGVVGSITHCAGYRAAAVAAAGVLASIGIDAEPDEALPDGVEAVITVAEERAMLADLAAGEPGVRWDRLLFSAKESVFKAWYPLTRRELDFDEAALFLDPSSATFTAKILVDGSRIDGGPPLSEMTGRYLVAHDVIVTAVTSEISRRTVARRAAHAAPGRCGAYPHREPSHPSAESQPRPTTS